MEGERRNHYHTRGSGGRSLAEVNPPLNWGNRKRLRCVKFQRKDDVAGGDKPTASGAAAAATEAAAAAALERRFVRAEKDSGSNSVLRRTASPTRQRALRSSETAVATRANGTSRGLTSPDRATRGGASAAGPAGSAEEKKSSSSGSEGAAAVWPRFAIALTNKEKEEDFLVFKGSSKLPQRPKKRAKLIQKTLNLVSPGAWLCDLTLERYEVREKKISKKKPRGLKAMGNLESDSE